MSILVVAAVRQEVAPFLESMNGNKQVVRVLVTGIGSSRTLPTVKKQLQGESFRLVISAGFAGATQPDLRVGDLVLASEVLDIASGRRWVPARFEMKENSDFTRGRLATLDRPLAAPKEKSKFGARYGTAAVDMETAAVAAAASDAGVPWVSLRAILDPMEVTLAIRSWQEGFTEIIRPWRWGEFRYFLKTIRVAAESLSKGLTSLIQESQGR